MDRHGEDSESDGDSITLDVEGDDSVVVHACNERRFYVTKVLIGPLNNDRSTVVEETTVSNHEAEQRMASTRGDEHQLATPFGPLENRGPPSQTLSSKQYQQLTEALSQLDENLRVSSQTQVPKSHHELAEAMPNPAVSEHGNIGTQKSLIPCSPTLSRIVRNSIYLESNPSSNNPFLTPDVPNGGLVIQIVNSPGNAAVSPGTVPERLSETADAAVKPTSVVPVGQLTDEPSPSQGLPGDVAARGNCSSESDASHHKKDIDGNEAIPSNPESISKSSTNQTDASDVDPTAVQLVTTPTAVQLLATPNNSQTSTNIEADPKTKNERNPFEAFSQQLTPTQETSSTPGGSSSSFRPPRPPPSVPLVRYVPAKEVKFEEPPKHQVVTAVENTEEKLGEIVQIIVQPSHITQNTVKRSDEPNVIVLQTNSSALCHPKDVASTVEANQANNAKEESKVNHIKNQEVGNPPHQNEFEEREHSYGIIGNEDNLSEITLTTLADGRDQDVGPCNNGQTCHRIRISIDQQPATPSKRTMAITVVLVVLVVTAVILLAVYRFTHP